jgi:hypothetical protein
MSGERSSGPQKAAPWAWLEWLTAAVLAAVLAAVAWMVVVAFQPGWLRLPSEEAEVVGVLALLAAALGLVSVVALLHTRK